MNPTFRIAPSAHPVLPKALLLGLGGLLLWASCLWAEPVASRPFMDTVPAAAAAPAFRLPDLHGIPVTNGDVRGRYTVLNFWATWCVPCLKEMPSLQSLQDRFAQQPFVVLAVNVMDPTARISGFLAEQPLKLRIVRDESGQSLRDFGIVGFPTTLVLDPDGRLVARAVGARAWDSPESLAYFRKLMGGTASSREAASAIPGVAAAP